MLGPMKRWLPLTPCLLTALTAASCQDYEVTRVRVFDTFTQAERDAELDVLWVLDDSLTMIEEQEQLAATVDTFIEFMTIAEVPFQLGVVTTDMDRDDAGALREGMILDRDTPDIGQVFADLVLVDDAGSRDERGLDAAAAAADPSGPNPDFARADADLEVIFFTDEDDQSRLDPDEALEALEDPRSGRDVGITAIIGDLPEGCYTVYAAADAGTRYAELADMAGGLVESICVSDYEAMLQRVALQTLGLVDTFQLSAVPELSSMLVRVDGALVHERDRHGWRYDPAENTIVFDGYAIPPPGAVVDIDYYEWYGPTLEEEEGDTGA
jgi:hypothetical protein